MKTGRIIHNDKSIYLYPGCPDWELSGRFIPQASVNVMDADLHVEGEILCHGINSNWTSDERFKRDIQTLDSTLVLDALSAPSHIVMLKGPLAAMTQMLYGGVWWHKRCSNIFHT